MPRPPAGGVGRRGRQPAVRNAAIRACLLFGSDWPVIAPERWLVALDRAPFGDGVRPLILQENAVRLPGG